MGGASSKPKAEVAEEAVAVSDSLHVVSAKFHTLFMSLIHGCPFVVMKISQFFFGFVCKKKKKHHNKKHRTN
jgi:hypothetical protein